ncbi:hypothetical protein BDV93DRAFT_609764 [Ceratobasidium sp. AG-I]|nr:hypothetical protein BDV93DRAFT_609764 [Ceratobasidium sp. AG-I]
MSAGLFFHTPELIETISDHVDRRDLVKLASTSRCCFAILVGRVWREVKGVHNLFLLIPGAKCSTSNYNKRKLVLPDLSNSDLTRFNFYAPYVRSLDILPNQMVRYRFSGWGELMQYAKTTTLLPNLRTLTFGCTQSKDSSFINWIMTFLSPAVMEIYTSLPDSLSQSRLSIANTEILLKAIIKQCPSVSTLSIFPMPESYSPHISSNETGSVHNLEPGVLGDLKYETHSDTFGTMLASDSNAEINSGTDVGQLGIKPMCFYDYLKFTQCLSTLSTSIIMMVPEALEILGSLPQLASLNVHYQFCEDVDCFDSSGLSEDSFLSLRALSLNFCDIGCIEYIWGTTPLVNRLTSLTFNFNGEARDSYPEDSDDGLGDDFLDFLPTICSHSPNVQDFTIDFDAAHAETSSSIPIQTLECLSTLPLRKLDLRNAILVNIPRACQTLSTCPTLRDLYLQDQQISYGDMLSFTQIASLECLHAHVKWQNYDSIFKCQDPIPFSSNLRFLQCSNRPHVRGDEKLTQIIIFFLITAWPGLEEVAWVGTTFSGPAPGVTDLDCVLITLLIRRLRSKRALPLRLQADHLRLLPSLLRGAGDAEGESSVA